MIFDPDLIFTQDFLVWDAVVAWSNAIYESTLSGSSKNSYFVNMLKLIESEVVDVRMPLDNVDEAWLNGVKKQTNAKADWSSKTKLNRKSCLNSFQNFVHTSFDRGLEPYRRYPKPSEIKYVLSNVLDQRLTVHIHPSILCSAISKINERDAYIVWVLMYTGQTLESILDRRKEHLRGIYLDFEFNGKLFSMTLLNSVSEVLAARSVNHKVYLFETDNGKRIRRTQITRNLKQAGRNIGLNFDLTPKALHRYVNAYMSADKRSELERALWY